MTSIKLATFTILMTLIIQSILILGETLLAQETNKDNDIKTGDKRNNFRVPVEMPYGNNFWPARGRRSRRDPEKVTPQFTTDNCITSDGNYIFEKTGTQCLELSKIQTEEPIGKKLQTINFEFLPSSSSSLLDEDFANGVDKIEGDCTKEKFGLKIPQILTTNFLMNPKRVDKIHKKQTRFGFPLILYGNEFYWEPENLYGEKKKKQDVFWVARGKKIYPPTIL